MIEGLPAVFGKSAVGDLNKLFVARAVFVLNTQRVTSLSVKREAR